MQDARFGTPESEALKNPLTAGVDSGKQIDCDKGSMNKSIFIVVQLVQSKIAVAAVC